MKFNFKKIAAIAGSVLLTGMSAGIASAAAFPQPFVTNGTANVAIVYGTGTGVSNLDVNQSSKSIQTALAGSVSGGTTTITGEKQNLATSARKLYYADSINAGYPSLSSNELPSVLGDGTFSDLSGTQYTYTQTITLGTTASAFGTSGGDLDDPTLLIDVGTSSAAPLYNYTVSFNKNVNVSDSTNVQGQKISLLGVDYVIGASSTNSTLYLYGSGADVTLGTGDNQTVTVGGSSHTVSLVAATTTTQAKITVDGVSKTVTQGNSYSFAGDLNVYVKDVTYQSYQGGIQSVELLVGANTLKLVNGQTVKQGADATSIKNTLATITGTGSNGEISGFTVAVAAQKSQSDSLVAGDTFTDPVFGGFKLAFTGANPALDSTDRGMITVDTDNNQFARATFTSARAGSAGEQQLTYTYDNATSSSSVAPILAHKVVSSNSQGLIHVLEGENAKQNDWVVVNSGDAGTILEVSDISIDTATSGTVTLQDAITGESQQITLTNSSNVYTKTGVNMFGGTGYTIKAAGDGTSMNITWGSSTTSLFPRIKLAEGGWIAFAQNTTVDNATSVIFPDGLTTLATSGTTVLNSTATYLVNGINWSTENNAGNVKVTGINGPSCSFTTGPAVIFIEPKKWDDSSYGNFICVPMTTAGTTEIAVAQAVLNGTNSGFTTLTTDTYESQAVDEYGTLVTDEQRTNQNGVETISYPKSQMYLDVVATSEAATVTSSALGDVLVTDKEVSSVKDKNLVIVGGSCINSAAATALGVSPHTCGDAFTAATGVGAGQFLIEGIQDKFSTGKLALVVAGYEAADTINAATYLTKKTVDTSKKYIGTSATEATMQTSSA